MLTLKSSLITSLKFAQMLLIGAALICLWQDSHLPASNAQSTPNDLRHLLQAQLDLPNQHLELRFKTPLGDRHRLHLPSDDAHISEIGQDYFCIMWEEAQSITCSPFTTIQSLVIHADMGE